MNGNLVEQLDRLLSNRSKSLVLRGYQKDSFSKIHIYREDLPLKPTIEHIHVDVKIRVKHVESNIYSIKIRLDHLASGTFTYGVSGCISDEKSILEETTNLFDNVKKAMVDKLSDVNLVYSKSFAFGVGSPFKILIESQLFGFKDKSELLRAIMDLPNIRYVTMLNGDESFRVIEDNKLTIITNAMSHNEVQEFFVSSIRKIQRQKGMDAGRHVFANFMKSEYGEKYE